MHDYYFNPKCSCNFYVKHVENTTRLWSKRKAGPYSFYLIIFFSFKVNTYKKISQQLYVFVSNTDKTISKLSKNIDFL